MPDQLPVNPAVDRLWARARGYLGTGQGRAAQAALESLLQRDPGHVPARLLLAGVYLDLGRVRDAAREAATAAAEATQSADSASAAAHACVQLGEMCAARDCLARFAAGNPRLDGAERVKLAYAYERLGDNAAASALLARAAAEGYDDPDFRYFYASQFQFNGDLEAARGYLEGCLGSTRRPARALWSLAQLGRATPPAANHIETVRAALARVPPDGEDAGTLEFALYRELEDLGDFPAAFAALAQGNRIMHALWPANPGEEARLAAAIVACCTRDVVAGGGIDIDGPAPIFVVGLPRSGTTLLAQVLGNHPDVCSAGERSDFLRQLRWVADAGGKEAVDRDLVARFPDLDYRLLGQRYLAQTQWRAAGRRFYVDKLPANYQVLGLVHRALPRAPILHMARAPMDVCFSNYRALLGDGYPYSYEFRALARHYDAYRRLMAHWREVMPGVVFDVDYAAFVTRPEAVLAAIFAHCGLPEAVGCNDPTRNPTAVNTLSSPQVREPIHRRALGAWHKYETQLAPLAVALRASGYPA